MLSDSRGSYPHISVGQMGQKIYQWLYNFIMADENETDDQGEYTVNAKIKQTVLSALYNFEFSAGIGMGFYGETEVWDAIGLSAGMYITNLSACYENGRWIFGNEAYTGISATFLWNEIGAAEFGFRPNGGEWENDYWVLYNDTESSITIYSASAYLFAGGSVRIGFDLNTFLGDVSKILGVGL